MYARQKQREQDRVNIREKLTRRDTGLQTESVQ